jgi:carboxyl-terminal processing protease
MLPASNRGVGMNIGFPDVCNTIVGPATVPIPYPNLAMNAQATPFSSTVKVSMMNALNMASSIPMTSGDEAGTAHPTIKGAGRYTMGNPIVSIENMPAINLTCPTTGNNMNNPVGAVLVPSAVTVFYTYQRGESMTRLSAEDLVALGEASLGAEPVSPGGMLPGGVGYLAIGLFSVDLAARVWAEVRALEARGMRALVLDLRDNPGGELDAFVRLAADFLAPGAIIVRTVDGDGDELAEVAPRGNPYAFPLVLLVNRGTASAAELFAGCLLSHRRALLVGERTYGKGIAQQAAPSADGDGVDYVTAARCLLPNGDEVQGAGVEPDLEIERGGQREEDDAQLRAAWECALEMLAL